MLFLGFSPKKCMCLCTMRPQNIHNSLMYKNQTAETSKRPIKGRMGKQIMDYSSNGILGSNEHEDWVVTCDNMNWSHKHDVE